MMRMRRTKKLGFGLVTMMGGLLALSAVVLVASRATRAMPSSSPSAFNARCAGCHGADGSGNTPAGKRFKAPDLRSREVQALSDAQLYQVIAKGKGKMPGYENSLGAPTCKELAAYVRKLGGR